MSDPALPQELQAFTRTAADIVGSRLRWRPVEVAGPLQITVGQQTVNLTDLYRTRLQDETLTADQLYRVVAAHLAARRLERTYLPFDTVAQHIRPLIQPSRVLMERGPHRMAHQPFVNDLAISYVIDLNGDAAAITTPQLMRWHMTIDELDAIARQNLTCCEGGLKAQLIVSEGGRAATFNIGDGYDAARLLLDNLHAKLASDLGGDFLVAIPARDVFIAFPDQRNAFAHKLNEQIISDFRRMPYPVTPKLFLVTRDGVAGGQAAA